jgi:hypothetical protein
MAVDAARAHTPALPARPRRRPRARGVPKRRLAGGVAWIAVVAALLSGIVALNVAVLRLNLRLDELRSQRTELRTENAELQAQAAFGAVPETIRTEAYEQGYRAVHRSRIRYLELERTAR